MIAAGRVVATGCMRPSPDADKARNHPVYPAAVHGIADLQEKQAEDSWSA